MLCNCDMWTRALSTLTTIYFNIDIPKTQHLSKGIIIAMAWGVPQHTQYKGTDGALYLLTLSIINKTPYLSKRANLGFKIDKILISAHDQALSQISILKPLSKEIELKVKTHDWLVVHLVAIVNF